MIHIEKPSEIRSTNQTLCGLDAETVLMVDTDKDFSANVRHTVRVCKRCEKKLDNLGGTVIRFELSNQLNAPPGAIIKRR